MTRIHARPRIAALLITALCALTLGLRAAPRQTAPAAAPHRIVSLVPAVTEMLFAIGAGDAVVGVSSYDHFPPEVNARTRVGALVDPDYERILSLRPDLVIVYGTQNDLTSRLTHAGIPYFSYEHAGLREITATIRALGDRVGHAIEATREVDRIQTGLADIRRRVAGQSRPKTMLVFEREAGSVRGAFASGGIGFLHDMLEVAGGTNVFGDVQRQSVQFTAEMLLARAPDVILELRPSEGWSADRIARERDVWRAFAAVPAVRTNRIYIFDDDSMMQPGPRVVEAVRRMATALHPGS